MSTNTTIQTPTYHIVAFGPNEADCQTYIDHHDGTLVSQTAEARATSFFLSLAKDGVRCGFWTNGRLVAGVETAEDVPLRPTPRTSPRRSLAHVREIPGLPRLASAAFRAPERDHSIPAGA